jgi:hypothetical protein
MRFSLPLIAALALATPAFAQQPQPQPLQQAPSGQSTAQGCNPSGRADAATPPTRSGDSTAPGNASTGWTGGMGGSHTGTNTQGATQNSPTWHAPTARGLDPLAAPVAPEAAC